MEPQNATLLSLHEQELALCERIDELEAVVEASAPGIREFRMTRLRQLKDQHLALRERLRRFESFSSPLTEAHTLGAAFREARLVAQGTFGR